MHNRRQREWTDGSLLGIVTRPGAAAILLLAALFLALPFLLRLYARASGRREAAELVETSVG